MILDAKQNEKPAKLTIKFNTDKGTIYLVTNNIIAASINYNNDEFTKVKEYIDIKNSDDNLEIQNLKKTYLRRSEARSERRLRRQATHRLHLHLKFIFLTFSPFSVKKAKNNRTS